MSRPDSKKSFNETSVSYSDPTRHAFHTFDALTARFEKKAQIHLGALVRPGGILEGGCYKGINKTELELQLDNAVDHVEVLFDTGASPDMIDAQQANERDHETRVVQFPWRI